MKCKICGEMVKDLKYLFEKDTGAWWCYKCFDEYNEEVSLFILKKSEVCK